MAVTQVYTTACNGCGSSTRIEVIGRAAYEGPQSFPGKLRCPCCGSVDINQKYKTGMDDDEYWYWLADSMGLPRTAKGAALAKTIFAAWDSSEYPRFMDFYRSFDEEEK